jgi:hypothetical protein
MSHVPQHLQGCRADVDLLRRNTERAHKLPGVALGRLSGREARHGETEDRRTRQAEPVADLGGDDKRVRGVETPETPITMCEPLVASKRRRSPST